MFFCGKTAPQGYEVTHLPSLKVTVQGMGDLGSQLCFQCPDPCGFSRLSRSSQQMRVEPPGKPPAIALCSICPLVMMDWGKPECPLLHRRSLWLEGCSCLGCDGC